MAIGDTKLNASTSFTSTGGYNTSVGSTNGSNYSNTEASNILIGANIAGTANESNVCRIGVDTGSGNGEISECYIAGITGVGVIGSAMFVTSGNQLGVLVSSRKYKNNINNMDNFSNDILKLRPVTFVYKDDEEENIQPGLIAEEVAQDMPELVVYDDEGKPKSVKYHLLPVLLLNELQKALARIHELELRLGV